LELLEVFKALNLKMTMMSWTYPKRLFSGWNTRRILAEPKGFYTLHHFCLPIKNHQKSKKRPKIPLFHPENSLFTRRKPPSPGENTSSGGRVAQPYSEYKRPLTDLLKAFKSLFESCLKVF